jgi:hypothetical protein
MSSPVGHELKASVLRFLQVLSKSPDAEVLGPSLLRELYFHFLTGEQGNVLRSALTIQGRFGSISTVLKYIHSNYSDSLNLNLAIQKRILDLKIQHN